MSNELTEQEKTIVDSVQKRIAEMQNSGSIELPNNYSVGSALKSAYLILQEAQTSDKKSVLQVCTQESIANSLLGTATQGLNPSENQCYFIIYGNKLTMERGYLGTIALTKRIRGVKDVKGYAVYKDDKFELGFGILTGKQRISEFYPGFNCDPKNLVGAFALILGNNGILHTEYMDINRIHKTWEQGGMKGNSGAHKNLPDQMAIKTVISCACKHYVSTSDDSDRIVEFMSKSVGNTDRELGKDKKEFVNKEVIEIEEIPETVDVETRKIIKAEIEDTNESQAPFQEREMIDVKTIGSGSSGNCYPVNINGTKMLPERGLTFKKIQKALNYKVSDIDSCLVTHEYMDHSKIVKDLTKAGIDCYMTEGTAEALRVSGHRLRVFKNWAETKYKTTYINNILIQLLRSMHDAKEPVMYYTEGIKTKKSSLFVTDTAFMAYKISENINTLVIECNYAKKPMDERVDDKVINVSLRSRIVKNHMSLETILETLEDVKMTRLKKVYMLHLSNGNSDERLIRDSIDKKLGVPVEVC